MNNDPIKGILTVHDMRDIEFIDERGNWWETESPVKEEIHYIPKSEEYFDTLKELKQKYNV
ncbi:hypothetical protein FD00_GL002032 [Liquorilactobacillus mali KCTC 3596 = DSM 20444]|uniref:Uncharacterized protein n=2 Tax=Liquorilactobacillus mali TaxID=1618 RepID=A0A0R2E5A2_9LACO|nr:hypothetical protein FD00_GL002032 [Liquorilactobacillus mali KCTC 3596 = DSM 20444]